MLSNFIQGMIEKRQDLDKITLTLSKGNIDQIKKIADSTKLSLSQIIDLLLMNALKDWKLMQKSKSKNHVKEVKENSGSSHFKKN